MSEPAIVPPMDFGDAVAKGAERCLEMRKPPSEVLRDSDLDLLSPAAFRKFARRGWIFEVNNALHDGRTPPTEQAVARAGSHPAGGRNPRGAWKPLDIALIGADGALKRLASFELTDLEHLRNEAQAMETGWGKRRAWAERAAELLKASKKTRIEQLTKFQLDELGKLAMEAWS